MSTHPWLMYYTTRYGSPGTERVVTEIETVARLIKTVSVEPRPGF